MNHFGILCPPGAGHLNPMTALGHELQKRGHRVTLFGLPDTQSKTLRAGLEFRVLGESEFPVGSVEQSLTRLGELNGLAAFQFTINQFIEGAKLTLKEAPTAIKEAGIEALLIDQTLVEGGTIAEFLNIPFITICNALLLHPEVGVPPIFTDWNYDPSWWANLRNQTGYTLFGIAIAGSRIGEVVEDCRKEWGLPAYSSARELWSQLAQISQQPAEFEFPRNLLPQWFHFTGPFINPAIREPTPFPFEKLTGQPLIYASLGTVQNRSMWIFHKIAEACAEINAQLVISLGRSGKSDVLPEFPGNPVIVEFAPQLELLKKAALTITHAGLNTVLESLSNGVPMVAIPITNDQPGVAARIVWTGTGEAVSLNFLGVNKLRAAIRRVLTEDSYKQNAVRLQEAIRRAGVARAADIIEQAISTGKPVHK